MRRWGKVRQGLREGEAREIMSLYFSYFCNNANINVLFSAVRGEALFNAHNSENIMLEWGGDMVVDSIKCDGMGSRKVSQIGIAANANTPEYIWGMKAGRSRLEVESFRRADKLPERNRKNGG